MLRTALWARNHFVKPTPSRSVAAVRGDARVRDSHAWARPRWRWLTVGLCLFSAVSAIGGGITLCVGQQPSPYMPPLRLLDDTPFTSFVVPGLLLAAVVGGTSLLCAVLTLQRSAASIDAALLAGGALSIWISAEAAMLRAVHWLHVVYGLVGLAILGLGVSAAVRSQRPRHRWLVFVTAAEALGFLAPVCAGMLSFKAGIEGFPQAVLLAAAGLIEGCALGAGQAWAWPLPLGRSRYALLSALGAGLVWFCVMSTVALAQSSAVPIALVVVGWVATAIIGLLAIGTAQWIELRHHASGARRWIGWTATAWVFALPLSFTPGPFVDESTPLASQLTLWICAGLLMAYAMALITWLGVRRILAAQPHALA